MIWCRRVFHNKGKPPATVQVLRKTGVYFTVGDVSLHALIQAEITAICVMFLYCECEMSLKFYWTWARDILVGQGVDI